MALNYNNNNCSVSKIKLGSGSFGGIYIASDDGGRTVIKTLGFDADKQNYKSVSHNEIDVLFRLRSPYLLMGYSVYDKNFCGKDIKESIRLERCTGNYRDLFSPDSIITYQDIKKIMYHYALGLRCLHRNKIIHLDLSPNNLMYNLESIKGKNEYIGKIIDFGASCYLGDIGNIYSNPKGNPIICPPEFFVELDEQKTGWIHYTYKSDIWALGVNYLLMMFQMDDADFFEYRGKNIDAEQLLNTVRRIIITKLKPDAILDSIFTINGIDDTEKESFYNLMVKVLHYEPERRCNIEDVVDDPFFNSVKHIVKNTTGDACNIIGIDPFISLAPFTIAKKKALNIIFNECKYCDNLMVDFLDNAINIYIRLAFALGPSTSQTVINFYALMAFHVALSYYTGGDFYTRNAKYLKTIKQEEIKVVRLLKGIIKSTKIYDLCETVEEIKEVYETLFSTPNILEYYLVIDYENLISTIRPKMKTHTPKNIGNVASFVNDIFTYRI